MKFYRLFVLAALCLALVGCGSHNSGGEAPSASGSAQPINIAVIPMGTTHQYWKSIDAGAQQAAKKLGVTVTFKGPIQEGDRAAQISIVQQFVSSNISGIVLAPLDSVALVNPAHAAMQQKIPVVIIDSALSGTPGKDFVSFVATDSYKGGQLAAQALAKLMNNQGKVVVLRYEVGAASAAARENGFLDGIAKYPGIKVIDSSHYGGATQSEAQTTAMQMVDLLHEANGIFTPNESTTLGMLGALRLNGLAGKVKFVGFDTAPEIITAVKNGEINAVIAQNPVKIGYLGVTQCVDAIRHQPVTPKIDTGVTVITPQNVSTPPIVKLLAGT